MDGDFVERFLNFSDSDDASHVLNGRNGAQKITESFDTVVQALEHLQLVH